jgi:hypothetical protein
VSEQVSYVSHDKIAQAILLGWAWLRIDTSYHHGEYVLMRPTEVTQQTTTTTTRQQRRAAVRALSSSVTSYSFKAVDEKGSVYAFEMHSGSGGEASGSMTQVSPRSAPEPRTTRKS